MIQDSGERRQFETGAVRDISAGKGRCDLLPLDVVSLYIGRGKADPVLYSVSQFQEDGSVTHLYEALWCFANHIGRDDYSQCLETSVHYEEGCQKYGERNWQKGINVHCYIDSAVRHYLKFLRGDSDERHDRAFVWNIMGALWTIQHKPELNDTEVIA